MRVRIVFILKNKGAFVPFHHQYLLAQLVERVMENAPVQYRTYKNYNFSGLKGQTKVSKNGLHFYSSRVTLVFSSPNAEFIDYFINRLFEYRQVEIGTLLLETEMTEREEYDKLPGEVKYVCISPLVLVSADADDFYAKKFISPDTDIFSDLLYESTMNRMEKTGDYTAEQIASFFRFQILPDKDYLSKIREGEKKFARIYPVFEDEGKHEIRGYTFPFTLYAKSEVQEFLFNCGLGAYSQKGFGMLDLVNTDMKKRIVLHQPNKAFSSPTQFDAELGKERLRG